MTYKELTEALAELTPEQLELEVSVVTILPDEEMRVSNLSETIVFSELRKQQGVDQVLLDDIFGPEETDTPLLVIDGR